MLGGPLGYACASPRQWLGSQLVPPADLPPLQPRMQAEKCRTSGRNTRKEMVIESPSQPRAAAQREAEVESPEPVLVRNGGRFLRPERELLSTSGWLVPVPLVETPFSSLEILSMPL